MQNLAKSAEYKIDVEAFAKNGFLVLRNFLSIAEITALRSAMTLAIATFEKSPNGYDVTAAADAFWSDIKPENGENAVQHDLEALGQAIRNSTLPRLIDPPAKGARGRFILDTSVWRRIAALKQFALHGPLGTVASTLLDVPSVRYYDDQMFVKEGGAVDRTAFHQDVPYFHLDGARGCVFWIPLDAVGPGGGRIGYIPGSHKWAIYKPNVFVSEMAFPGSEGIDMPRIDTDPHAFGVEYIDVEPGDIIVHHFLTIHGAEGNRTQNRRRAFSLRYCDADLKYRQRPGAPAQPLHRQNMQDGDALDDHIHPIVV